MIKISNIWIIFLCTSYLIFYYHHRKDLYVMLIHYRKNLIGFNKRKDRIMNIFLLLYTLLFFAALHILNTTLFKYMIITRVILFVFIMGELPLEEYDCKNSTEHIFALFPIKVFILKFIN